MVDVFQVLLPQGAVAKGSVLSSNADAEKSALGISGLSSQTTGIAETDVSFKAAFELSLSPMKAPLPVVLAPESGSAATDLLPMQLGEEGSSGDETGESLLELSFWPGSELNESEVSAPLDAAVVVNLQGQPTSNTFYESVNSTSAQNFASGGVRFGSAGLEGRTELLLNDPNTQSVNSTKDGDLAIMTSSKLMFGGLKEVVPESQALSPSVTQAAPAAWMTGGSLLMPKGLKAMSSDQLALNAGVLSEALNTEAALAGKASEGTVNMALSRQGFEAALPGTYSPHGPEAQQTPEALKMSIRFGQPGWAEQLVERAANLAGQNIKQAEVQLNPQELGSIHIKISVSQEQAAVTFAAQNAHVREAIDQSLHRLREAFEGSGLDLVQADVHDQGAGNEAAEDNQQGASSAPIAEVDDSQEQQLVVNSTASGIDHFV